MINILKKYFKKQNRFWLMLILCMFIPFTGISQFFVMFLFTIILVANKIIPVKFFFVFSFIQIMYSIILSTGFPGEYFIQNTLFGLISLVGILIFISNQAKWINLNIDIEEAELLIRNVFIAYSFYLILQKVMNPSNPDSANGFHGLKGAHINAQMYLILSMYFIFEKKYYIGLYFVLVTFLGFFNTAYLIFLFAFLVSIFVNSLTFKQIKNTIAITILASIFIIALSQLYVFQSQYNFIKTYITQVTENPDKSVKQQFINNFFNNYFENTNVGIIFLGTSIGNGGNRAALFFTKDYFRGQVPNDYISTPKFVKEYINPYLPQYFTENYRAGTMNFPYSNLVGLISELGLFLYLLLIFFLFKFLLKNRKLYNDKRFIDFVFVYLLIFSNIIHEFEQIPLISVCLYLMILSLKKQNLVIPYAKKN